jgi:hypothetical protein
MSDLLEPLPTLGRSPCPFGLMHKPAHGEPVAAPRDPIGVGRSTSCGLNYPPSAEGTGNRDLSLKTAFCANLSETASVY